MIDLIKFVIVFFAIVLVHLPIVLLLQYFMAFMGLPGGMSLVIAVVVMFIIMHKVMNKFFDYILQEK